MEGKGTLVNLYQFINSCQDEIRLLKERKIQGVNQVKTRPFAI
jgi:hypothetical protein